MKKEIVVPRAMIITLGILFLIGGMLSVFSTALPIAFSTFSLILIALGFVFLAEFLAVIVMVLRKVRPDYLDILLTGSCAVFSFMFISGTSLGPILPWHASIVGLLLIFLSIVDWTIGK